MELTQRFFLLGLREDVPRITAALDIACLSAAFGEGFPNVLGEAMACGVPCVATDVGDSAAIIGKTGQIVAPSNPCAFALGCEKLIHINSNGRAQLGKAARSRINKHFELSSTVRKYEKLYINSNQANHFH